MAKLEPEPASTRLQLKLQNEALRVLQALLDADEERDRFLAHEVWENLGLPVDECLRFVNQSESQVHFRSLLFTRIAPTLKDVGLFGSRVRSAFADMGVLGYSNVDLDALISDDERTAGEIDAGRRAQVEQTISAGSA